jgi:hypothetical protein
MTHLVRLGILIAAVLVVVFIVLRAIPYPAFLADYGFNQQTDAENMTEWASLPIAYANSAVCVDCHSDNYELWEISGHRTVACENCHGPAAEHLENGTFPSVDPSRDLCATCHARLPSRPSSFPQVDMAEMGGQAECRTCHDPHEPRAGMPPQVPHILEGRFSCKSCHGPHEPWETPPPELPHTLEGRTDCLSCHGPEEYRGATLPYVPHSLEGRSNCLLCHNTGGIRPFPEDHAGRKSNGCLNCHRISEQ